MSSNEIRVSRRQLYEQVWSTPMTRLAKQYGLSDVGLAKICKKYDIPRPGLGHWAQVEHGVAIGVDELPNPNTNPEIVVRAHQPPVTSSPGQTEFANIFARALATEAYQPCIVVAEAQNLHEWGTASLEALRTAKTDEWSRRIPEHDEALDIRVSDKSLLRAHRIMNTLLTELKSRGCDVRPVPGRAKGTFVRICGEFVAIRITEMLKVEAVESGKTVQSGYYDYPPHPPWLGKQSVKQTGRLMLNLLSTSVFRDKTIRRTWRDSEHQRLEDCLNDIIVGIIRVATVQRNVQAKWVTFHAKNRSEEEESRIRENKRASAQARVNKLDSDIVGWTKARAIRRYVQEARLQIANTAATGVNKAEKWFRWAEKRADSLDPLSAQNIAHLGMETETEEEFYVRPELEGEYDEIRKLVRRVYAKTFGSGAKEVTLIQELRACGACDPELSLVAIQNSQIVGYVLFSNIGVRGRSGMCGVAIGPLCVDFECQRRGIGTELVDTGLVAAIDLGKSFVCVHGPLPDKFRQHFEFEPARDYGIETIFHSEHASFLQIGGAVEVGKDAYIEHPIPWETYRGITVHPPPGTPAHERNTQRGGANISTLSDKLLKNRTLC